MSDDGDEWTSLPLREATRDRFRTNRPQEASSADAFLNTLLDEYEGVDTDDVDVAERLDAVMNKLEQLEGAQADTVGEALELADISNHDVLEQLDTVERAAKEATSAAQSAENAVNKLAEERR